MHCYIPENYLGSFGLVTISGNVVEFFPTLVPDVGIEFVLRNVNFNHVRNNRKRSVCCLLNMPLA
jgi:hypothetical protein